VLLPSALVSCAVVLSLESYPGGGVLEKALGLRKKLTAVSCLNSFITLWW